MDDMKLKYLLMILGISLWGLAGYQYHEGKESRSWAVTKAKVVLSEVTHQWAHTSKSGPLYFPSIEYQFNLNNKTYVGDTIQIGFPENVDYARAKAIVARYPEGSVIEIHYNPANPDESVINLPANYLGIWTLGSTGIIFLILGFCIDKELAWLIRKFTPKHVHKYMFKDSLDTVPLGLDVIDLNDKEKYLND